ncbi:metallophosphoesterase [bacterium]|nr:metallophosphoesterase [bacterium]
MSIFKLTCLTAACAMLASCDAFDVHPYDGKIDGEVGINERNVGKISAGLAGRSEIRFAVISDTQRWFDELEDEVESINRRGDIDFVLHCGDLTDYGITKEFEWQRDKLAKLSMPYVVVIGNHDCLGSGRDVFRKMFGNENFSFVAGRFRFICMDTNALEYDFSHPVPDLKFLKGFAAKEDVEGTVMVIHAKPGDEEFDNNVSEPFHDYIMQLKNPLFCVCGHGHVTEAFDLFGDGFMYYEITCAKDRQYYVFTVNGEGYEYETVDY